MSSTQNIKIRQITNCRDYFDQFLRWMCNNARENSKKSLLGLS